MRKTDINDLSHDGKSYFFPCQDGTDPQCEGDVELDVSGDTPRSVVEVDVADGAIEPICGPCGSDYTRDQNGDIVDG